MVWRHLCFILKKHNYRIIKIFLHDLNIGVCLYTAHLDYNPGGCLFAHTESLLNEFCCYSCLQRIYVYISNYMWLGIKEII
jgi:hypothetical protein